MSAPTQTTARGAAASSPDAAPRGFLGRSTRRWLLLAAGLVLALVLPWVIYPPVAMDIAAWALFAVALDLLLGYAGLLSFGHAAFWGGSAYVAGLTAVHWGLPFPLAVLVGAVFAMALAWPIGMLSVRRSGIYFAMVTLAFAQMLFFVVNQWRGLTGGENGLQGVPAGFFGVEAVEREAFWFYYAALPMIIGGMWLAWRVVHSPFGRVLVATRDNPARARALGYDVDRYRVMVFVISAGLAGVAGGLFAISHGFVSLQEVAWQTSGKVVLITVLGGIGTLWGAIVGAVVIVILEDQLASSGFDGIGIITGSVFIIVVLLFRRGVWGTVADAVARRTGRRPADEAVGAADGEDGR
ncbi:branched-chain amino acid ABC transporter permease [Ornithinimicrobium pekingense]|uniref:Branched-chain amino acid ABC transporter permease n=1 Tax=Ornithinimicrobium pekingense TaxID=384677 RepID=A0ABQ2FAM5_9MICO|nr:branched-chain amino acid ABC transporter permease [Ornithinimicrobium pekingense]GGK70184.1 branched-chain amino acid ABC transporter permease [Ornithinimicrobium pekingense]